MFGPKSGLLKIAAILSIITSTIALSQPANAADATINGASNFLTSKFVEGKAVEGFTPGKFDYGITLESMLQRRAAGRSLASQNVSVNFVLNTRATGGLDYLYAPADKSLLSGLAGKFLFTAKALKAPVAPNTNKVLAALKKAIAADGTIAGSTGNTFDYAWVTLGLQSMGQTALATRVEAKLIALAKTDGGFGYDQTADSTNSSVDSTGIALQAMAALKGLGGARLSAANKNATAKAVAWLNTQKVTDAKGAHWESWGAFDVNGTAYAAMGLKAAGQNVASISSWLKTKIASDGGVVSAWSGGKGDAMATSQSIVPMLGLSYLDLLKK